ncbi:MAG: NAD(P)-binding domain-containing protein [Calditrichaeota bacterium]|nr:NAD(P)-binding domain-containing protein [Calditrichota bacterium]MCB9391905.1 NAD(P)-binding domain-containing protein [Calditrichota bacterium]
MSLETLIYVVTGALVVGLPAIYVWNSRRSSVRAANTLAKALEAGLDQPVSLHPVIDPNLCIGSGSCTKACPEQGILQMIDGKAALVNPARCIGHGQCQAACPVDAITLVFGTEKRGVDIPHVKGNFETNVPGIFIAGELGGMGLIRNAVAQGRQAVEAVTKQVASDKAGEMLDLFIVGAGPAGISASLQAKKDGLRFVTVDQEDLGGTIYTYPRQKLVMTQPMELPLHGTVKLREIEKEPLLELLTSIVKKNELDIRGGEKVSGIEQHQKHYKITTSKDSYEARKVLLAIGRRGTPRKIGCPGEKCDKVTYRLLEPEKYHHKHILVVGGGDSAVEAAVALSGQPGNKVYLSYRGDKIFRIKEGNRTRLELAAEERRVTLLLNSNVTEIRPDTVKLDQSGTEVTLQNDQVFVMIGGELPTEFLKSIGISFERKYGEA